MSSLLSADVSTTIPNAAPAAPAIINVSVEGRKAALEVAISTIDEDGGLLANLPTKLHVFYKGATFAGSTVAAEQAAGTPLVTVEIVNTTVGVSVDGLERGKTYYFAAFVE